MQIKYEVSAITGSFINKDGEEKKRWVKCGVIVEKENGKLALKLEAVPIGGDGWFNLQPPKPKDEHKSDKEKSVVDDQSDDIPF